jgi:hypothetical protein
MKQTRLPTGYNNQGKEYGCRNHREDFFMLNLIGLVGMVFTLVGALKVNNIIEKSSLNLKQKVRINILLFALTILSTGISSFMFFWL